MTEGIGMTETSEHRIINPIAFPRGTTVSNRSGRNHLRARSGRSAARVVFILLLSFVVISRSMQRRSKPAAADDSTPPPATVTQTTGKYVPAGDEGLGAAVA